jgi:WD40 repeat protein
VTPGWDRAALSPDGKRMVTAVQLTSNLTTMQVRDIASGHVVSTYQGGDVSWKYIATAFGDNTIQVWRVPSRTVSTFDTTRDQPTHEVALEDHIQDHHRQ